MQYEINKIMCCCGNGVGTSLIMQMTVEEALEDLGIFDVEVFFGSLSDISETKADLFVVSQEVLHLVTGVTVIGLDNLMDSNEASEKLRQYFDL